MAMGRFQHGPQQEETMIFVSMMVSFLILLCLVVAGAQNAIPVQIKFVAWTMDMSLSSLLLWAAAAGAGIVGFLSIPKLSTKSLQARRLRKEVRRLEVLCKGSE
jgi:uncharacterized integral membrane protein